jgi:hypothetical protein
MENEGQHPLQGNTQKGAEAMSNFQQTAPAGANFGGMREKPRIRRLRGWWVCAHPGTWSPRGFGRSPPEAFDDMLCRSEGLQNTLFGGNATLGESEPRPSWLQSLALRFTKP